MKYLTTALMTVGLFILCVMALVILATLLVIVSPFLAACILRRCNDLADEQNAEPIDISRKYE